MKTARRRALIALARQELGGGKQYFTHVLGLWHSFIVARFEELPRKEKKRETRIKSHINLFVLLNARLRVIKFYITGLQKALSVEYFELTATEVLTPNHQ